MITLNDPKWRALRLDDEEGVKYLNRLFRRGWYLMEINADGISHLMFQVPMKPPKYVEPRNAVHMVSPEADYFHVIVLRKGERKGRQHAIFQPRDEKGYVDLSVESKEPMPEGEWTRIMSMVMGAAGAVSILERKT